MSEVTIINHIAKEIERSLNLTYFDLAKTSDQFKKHFGSGQVLKILLTQNGFKVLVSNDTIDKAKLYELY
jgi:hypothetical protein